MLRYDRATPSHERDSRNIAHSIIPGANRTTRRIEIQGPKPPTEARWSSFGWQIVAHETVTVNR